DQPAVTRSAHCVVDLDRLSIGFDDPAAHHNPGLSRLLAGHFQLLSGITVEAVSINRRDVPSVALGHLLALSVTQTGPRPAEPQPRHLGDVKTAANDRVEFGEAPALAEGPAVLHRIEQSIVEAPHRVTAARRRGVDRRGKHAKTEPGG